MRQILRYELSAMDHRILTVQQGSQSSVRNIMLSVHENAERPLEINQTTAEELIRLLEHYVNTGQLPATLESLNRPRPFSKYHQERDQVREAVSLAPEEG